MRSLDVIRFGQILVTIHLPMDTWYVSMVVDGIRTLGWIEIPGCP